MRCTIIGDGWSYANPSSARWPCQSNGRFAARRSRRPLSDGGAKVGPKRAGSSRVTSATAINLVPRFPCPTIGGPGRGPTVSPQACGDSRPLRPIAPHRMGWAGKPRAGSCGAPRESMSRRGTIADSSRLSAVDPASGWHFGNTARVCAARRNAAFRNASQLYVRAVRAYRETSHSPARRALALAYDPAPVKRGRIHPCWLALARGRSPQL